MRSVEETSLKPLDAEGRQRLRKYLAEQNISSALDSIQRAQHALDLACSELSPVVGAIPEWKRASRLSDQAKALFYAVKNRQQKLHGEGGPLVDDSTVDRKLARWAQLEHENRSQHPDAGELPTSDDKPQAGAR